MASRIPHIIRQKEESLLNEVTAALQTPEEFPLLFHVWGIGGVGKSTCLGKLEEKCSEQASTGWLK
jgi:signal recognition particle GTPase